MGRGESSAPSPTPYSLRPDSHSLLPTPHSLHGRASLTPSAQHGTVFSTLAQNTVRTCRWLAVVGLLVAAAAILRGQEASRPGASTAAPIRIGFLAPLSGPYVQNGRDINGFLLALDEIGYRVAGRPVELIVEDDEAIPAVGLTKARKLSNATTST